MDSVSVREKYGKNMAQLGVMLETMIRQLLKLVGNGLTPQPRVIQSQTLDEKMSDISEVVTALMATGKE